MALQLAPDEPEAGPWRAELLTVAAATVMQPGQGKGAGHRPVVLAVDGRSSSGKTTLAGRLQDVVADRLSCIPTTSHGGTPGSGGPTC